MKEKAEVLNEILKNIKELNQDYTKMKFAHTYLPFAKTLRGYKEIVNFKRLNLIIFGIESLCFDLKEEILEKAIAELQEKKFEFDSIRNFDFQDLDKAKVKEVKSF